MFLKVCPVMKKEMNLRRRERASMKTRVRIRAVRELTKIQLARSIDSCDEVQL